MCFNPTVEDPFYFHQMIISIHISSFQEASPDAMVLKLFCTSHLFGFETNLKVFTFDNFLNLRYSTIIKRGRIRL